MVCGGFIVVNVDCVYDSYSSCVVYLELCIVVVNDYDRDRDDCRDRIVVFIVGQLFVIIGVVVKLFFVVGCDFGRVYDINLVGERVLQSSLRLVIKNKLGTIVSIQIVDKVSFVYVGCGVNVLFG